ncbi:MAG TPA: chemotaxis-specific protein-glutamate methyltransferase CheB [Gemmatimonadaceae bacterium]|nr:chemotaxis-specific protein-glutamate methyltransferase CheB [Gemmatimonadaceae bacterium]
MIRVVVAEDSPTARALLVAMLASDPGIQVIGEAKTGAQAVEMTERLGPDLVTMDVEMPELDGLEATEQIMMRCPTPIVVISAQANERAVDLSLEATRAGALAVLPKPVGPVSEDFAQQREQLIATVKAMSAVKVVRRWRSRSLRRPTPPSVAALSGRSTTRLVAIGASTGGPAAVRDIVASLPANFPVPIVVVQHIAKGFVSGLAHWVNAETKLHVKVAEDGELVRAGTVYFAPDDQHTGIEVRAGDAAPRILLASAPKVGTFRPSATWLFSTAARALGPAVTGVILTGMGDDGVAGLRAVHAAGGTVLAQDEATSVIYGMPREAVRAGVVHAVVPLGELSQRLLDLVS